MNQYLAVIRRSVGSHRHLPLAAAAVGTLLASMMFLTFDGSAECLAAAPSPWTPVELRDSAIRVWGRMYAIGKNGLPERIVSGEQELLSSPVALVVNGQKDVEAATVVFSGVSEEIAAWKSTGMVAGLSYKCQGSVEFDGMMRLDVAIDGASQGTIETLLLTIPVHRRQATLLHYYPLAYDWPGVTFFKPDRPNCLATPKQWKCRFTPFVWLGNEERGLQWFCETDQGWSPRDAGAAMEVSENGEGVQLAVHLRDAGAAAIPSFRLTFGLMAGPVKPKPAVVKQGDVRYVHWGAYDMAEQMKDGVNPPVSRLDYLRSLGTQFIGMHEEWTDFEGMSRVTQPEKLKHLVQEIHRREMGIVLYHNMLLPSIAPEFETMGPDCLCEPRSAFYVHSRDPKQQDYQACYRSRWSQLATDGIHRLFEDYGIDGVYLDGAATPVACLNERHGCGYQSETGERRPTFGIFAAREQMKRLRQICDAQKKPTVIVAHMSSALTLPTLSFADVLLTGEQYWKAGEGFRPPLEFFRIECMGHPHGIPTHFIGYPPLGGNYARMMIAVHGTPSSWCPGGTDIWRYYEAFDIDNARWAPYWAAERLADTDHKDVLVSGHVSKHPISRGQLASMLPPSFVNSEIARTGSPSGRAILAVGNTAQTPVAARVRFSDKALGFSMEQGRAYDAASREILTVDGGEVRLSLEPEGVRWLLLFEKDREDKDAENHSKDQQPRGENDAHG